MAGLARIGVTSVSRNAYIVVNANCDETLLDLHTSKANIVNNDGMYNLGESICESSIHGYPIENRPTIFRVEQRILIVTYVACLCFVV